MPRTRRYAPPDSVHHVVNRRNERRELFATEQDFDRFLGLMQWAKGLTGMRIIAYCLMPNHWHMVLWPDRVGGISSYLQRLCTAHAHVLRRTTSTVGHGHIYQDRYHSFLVESETYYYHAIRYVEANPLRSGLVDSARHWRWSSLRERLDKDCERALVDDGPLPLPGSWPSLVDECVPGKVLNDLRNASGRQEPD